MWLLDLDSFSAQNPHPALAEEDRLRARTMRHPEAQRNFLAGRALCRLALSHYAALEPSSWQLRASSLGKPEVTGPASAPPLSFNLSHSGALAACVVTQSTACGIDIENLARPIRPLRIAEHSFAREEFEDLERQTEALTERFFAYWTLKEAYYKARGSGIPFRLGGARFVLEAPGEISFAPSEREETEANRWQFVLLRPRAEHLAAVALESGSTPLSLRALRSNDGARSFSEVDFVPERASHREVA